MARVVQVTILERKLSIISRALDSILVHNETNLTSSHMIFVPLSVFVSGVLSLQYSFHITVITDYML